MTTTASTVFVDYMHTEPGPAPAGITCTICGGRLDRVRSHVLRVRKTAKAKYPTHYHYHNKCAPWTEVGS